MVIPATEKNIQTLPLLMAIYSCSFKVNIQCSNVNILPLKYVLYLFVYQHLHGRPFSNVL